MGTAWVHDAPLAALALVAVCELIGAALTVTLIAMADRKDRPRVIRASAALLAALLPWRPRGALQAFKRPPVPEGWERLTYFALKNSDGG